MSQAPKGGAMPRRLHIGGQVRAPGWEVLDANPGPAVDHVGDARDLSRFADATFDDLYASHVLEHLDYAGEIDKALAEWRRVLKPGGKLHLSVPDLDVLARLFLDRQNFDVDARFEVMRMIFGGHVDAHDFHQAGLNEEFLRRYLRRAGFVRLNRVASLGLFADASEMQFEGTPISLSMTGEKPATPPQELFGRAAKAFQGGDMGRAGDLCGQLLEVDADHVGGLHLRGQLAMQSGDFGRAAESLAQARDLSPGDTFLLADLGNAYFAAGKTEEAEKCFREMVSLNAQFTPGWFNLGNLLAATARHEEAAQCYRRAVVLEPRFLEARANLGNALTTLRRLDEAESAFRDALALAPGHPLLLVNLGNVLKDLGRPGEAEACHRQALAVEPRFPLAHLNLGFALQAQRRLDEAAACFTKSAELAPDFAEAHCALGNLHQDRGAFEAAIGAYRRAIGARPDHADAHYNLGRILERSGDLEGAAASYRRAIEIRPDSADAWNNLGNVLSEADRHDEAVQALERAVSLAPGRAEVLHNLARALHGAGRNGEAVALLRRAVGEAPDSIGHQGLLMYLSYDPDLAPERLYQEHLEWARRYAPDGGEAAVAAGADPQRRLRIGYLSPDFRSHSVAYFIKPVLASHDRGQFEVFCYSNSDVEDATTQRLRGLSDHWEPVRAMDDEGLAATIRRDGIDILVDLAGHTSGNRLRALAGRPAPVQATWIGYNTTTGMSQIDYRLTDAVADPPGETDRFHSERLYRLPGCFCCYEPLEAAPAVGALPALARGFVTFGCFNNPAKLNDGVLESWARILQAVPESRLLLKGKGLGSAQRQRVIAERFACRGVAASRLEFAGADKEMSAHLRNYARVDVALDPFPYNGVTTTCEALWMGIPVVVLAGRVHAGRTGVTLLTHAGFPQWVARSGEEYVAIARDLASNLGRLGEIRAALREQLRRSPLMDAAGHTRAVEAVFREMWRRCCEDAR